MRLKTFPSLAVVMASYAMILAGPEVSAQDLEPRAYVNTPVGVNFLVAGYGHAAGGVAFDASVPLENAHVRTNAAVLAYARSLDIWGLSGKVDVIVPYAWTSGSADFQGQTRERNVSGFCDPRFRFSVNFYGAPALSLQQFSEYEQDLIVGASLQVTPPLGQYDPDKLLNNGTNRWAFRPEIGVSKALGPLTLEIAADVTFYTDNHDFFGGHTREQAPIYSLQGHLVYRLRSGIWAALDGNYYAGGRTTLDGVEGDDLQKNSRIGATIALPVNRYHSVKLYASTGVSTRTGSDFDAVGIAWQYRWGGGL
jgi:hypothetical protein